MSIRLAAALFLALVAACQPYIHDPAEFNRDQPNFRRPLTDRTHVDVCYATRKTTPQDLLALAEAECAKFNKVAHYRYSDVLECPMATPLRARFTCDPS